MEKIIDGLIYKQIRPGVYVHYRDGEEKVRAWYTGEIIAARRKELKLTQQQLADAVKLNRSTLSRYESGEYKKIDFKMLEALAEALDTTPEYLSGRVDDPHDVLDAQTPEETKEAALLQTFRSLSEDQKDAVIIMVEAMKGK